MDGEYEEWKGLRRWWWKRERCWENGMEKGEKGGGEGLGGRNCEVLGERGKWRRHGEGGRRGEKEGGGKLGGWGGGLGVE